MFILGAACVVVDWAPLTLLLVLQEVASDPDSPITAWLLDPEDIDLR